nr:helix-turn-helix domain-containing protein [uncultured Brevundimonas sp.]
MTDVSLRSIKSAHRVLEILEYFDRDHRTATVMGLSRALSYPQSSTSELLRCLTRLGYLHYNRFKRCYSPTARVALLGAWVEPALFRGGAVVETIDRIADAIGETIVLSTASNYVAQHLHVVDGRDEGAVVKHAGESDSLLHSVIGRLLLSSYQDAHVRSALHRLNAEEETADGRVNIAETVDELAAIRRQGWLSGPDLETPSVGVVSYLLPKRKGADRLALSVFAPLSEIERRRDEILAVIRSECSQVLPPEPVRAPPPTVTRLFPRGDLMAGRPLDRLAS